MRGRGRKVRRDEDGAKSAKSFTPEDFGDKGAAGRKELGGQPQRVQHQRRLRVRLRAPGATHVGRAVVDHRVRRRAAHRFLEVLRHINARTDG